MAAVFPTLALQVVLVVEPWGGRNKFGTTCFDRPRYKTPSLSYQPLPTTRLAHPPTTHSQEPLDLAPGNDMKLRKRWGDKVCNPIGVGWRPRFADRPTFSLTLNLAESSLIVALAFGRLAGEEVVQVHSCSPLACK